MLMNQAARHLTLEERETIALSLSEGRNFKEIAILIHKHPSTVAREIMRHKESVKKRVNFNGDLNHTCLLVRDCSIKHLCTSCKESKYCKNCIQRG